MIQAEDRLKAIFNEAVKLAREHHHEYITLEHLLKILVAQPEISEMMKTFPNHQYDTLVNELDDYVQNRLNEIKTKEDVYPKRTQSTDRCVNRAFTQAIFTGHEHVNCFHILSSMYGEKNSHAVYYLLKNNITKKAVVD